MSAAVPSTEKDIDRELCAILDAHPRKAITLGEDLNTVTPDLTLIIPTRNEAANIGPLLARLDSSLGALSAEILFVDDSEDDTAEQILLLGAGMRRSVRLLHRNADERAGGLGTAVVAGMRAARAPWVVVMDGDLQHPPEVVAQLFDAGRRQGVDLVVASRHAGDGSTAGLDGSARRGSSRLATRVAKLACPRPTGWVSDPMSGFFAVRLGALDVGRLRPYGYRILLELIVRSPTLRTAEVSYRFEPRYAGESKTSIREVLRFSRHLARLRGPRRTSTAERGPKRPNAPTGTAATPPGRSGHKTTGATLPLDRFEEAQMRTGRWRRVALPAALLAGVLASGMAVSADAAPPPPGRAPAVGENPAVQTWFKRQEAARIAVNNALQQAYLQLDGTLAAGNGCAQLLASSQVVLRLAPTPKRTLNPLVVAGVSQFRDGAVACLAGDVAGARQLLAAGAQARADAENQLDEVLEAPNGAVN